MAVSPSPAAAAEDTSRGSVLAAGMEITGELEAAEALLIAGRVEGIIRHSAQRLVIGSTGRIKAEVHAKNLIIEGEVEGDLHCSESVVVTKTARVIGNIRTVRITIEDGAHFSGRIDMLENESG